MCTLVSFLNYGLFVLFLLLACLSLKKEMKKGCGSGMDLGGDGGGGIMIRICCVHLRYAPVDV